MSALTFNENSAYVGGGLYNYNGSSPVITNCVFSRNSVGDIGGGILNRGGSNPIIKHSTFSKNAAVFDGGGIYNFDSSTGTLSNCILWDNSDKGGSDESGQIDGELPVINYSCVQGLTGTFGGIGNIGSDPLFTDLDNYQLMTGSPCIDAGTDAGVYSDILGNLRPYDFPGVDNNGSLPEFDMGAYEIPEPTTLGLLLLGGLALLKRKPSV